MAKSYPVEFKGTAFGDPARFASNVATPVATKNPAGDGSAAALTQAPKKVSDQVVLSTKALALASQSAGYKGTAFGDPI
jgi:hypothetical protein